VTSSAPTRVSARSVDPRDPSLDVIVGISGYRRNAAAAICSDDGVLAACEQERVTRVRGVGIASAGLPLEAVEAVLRASARTSGDIRTYAAGEGAIALPAAHSHVHVDHHFAHAATAFYTSPFTRATIFICDCHSNPEVSVWSGTEMGIAATEWRWEGPGFASLYATAVEASGLVSGRDEHKLEALARLASPPRAGCEASLFWSNEHRLTIERDWVAHLKDRTPINRQSFPPFRDSAEFAGCFQRQLGTALLQVLSDVRAHSPHRDVCLGGGLFYNTYLNTLVRESGLYERTFVPVNPGNAGLAVGAALAAGSPTTRRASSPGLSPFLGPEYDAEEIKTVLDNCKLSYEYGTEPRLLEQAVQALLRSQLVGWFQGRMEWGPRALGNRSILASPLSPYGLENLNVFLKRRESYRSYGVSVCEEDVSHFFDGPRSPFMEHELSVKDPDLFRHVLPSQHGRIRVHTVAESPQGLRALLKCFGAATGTPVLINTSFNGLHEPIVCTPRDAVRVFYGTGLDMLVIGNFILRK